MVENVTLERIQIAEIARPDAHYVTEEAIDHGNRGEDERFHSVIHEFARRPHVFEIFLSELFADGVMDLWGNIFHGWGKKGEGCVTQPRYKRSATLQVAGAGTKPALKTKEIGARRVDFFRQYWAPCRASFCFSVLSISSKSMFCAVDARWRMSTHEVFAAVSDPTKRLCHFGGEFFAAHGSTENIFRGL